MLFTKSLQNLTITDIEQFCEGNCEGMRIEYKRSFDESREKIGKVVSSFANTYGGVLILGIETDKDKPILPISGFKKPNEEIRLTIESICRDGIYPAVIPQVKEIQTRTEGCIVVVVLVDESVEAPHAIENSEKIFVRSGASDKPYKLSDVDTIERLFERRNQPRKYVKQFREEAVQRFNENVAFAHTRTPYLTFDIVPTFPRNPLISLASLYDLMTHRTPRFPGIGTFIFTQYQWWRVSRGVFRFGENYFVQINDHGHIRLSYLPVLLTTFDKQKDPKAAKYLFLTTVLEFVALAIKISDFFYQEVSFRGGVDVELSATNVKGLRVLFARDSDESIPQNQSYDHQYYVSNRYSREHLTQLQDICSDLITYFYWGFNQNENFDKNALLPFVTKQLSLLSYCSG